MDIISGEYGSKNMGIALLSSIQWWMQDFLKGGSVIVLRLKCVRKFTSHTHFFIKTKAFSIVLERLLALPVNLFLIKNSKVSYSSSFLSSLAREGFHLAYH